MSEYITVKELAEKWGLGARRVQLMCGEGLIPGAYKFAGVWAIPKDAERPVDGRVKTGEYKNWRQKGKVLDEGTSYG